MSAPRKVRKDFDRNDAAQVKADLQAWKHRLAVNKKRTSAARRLLAKLRGRRAHQRKLIARRRAQLDRLRASPAKRVLQAALECVGQTEQPAGSNRGPGIVSLCQQRILGYDGVPWCGCFVGYHLQTLAGLPITARIAYTPYIHDDAARGINGLKQLVAIKDARPGDLVLFHFGSGGIKHVGFVLENNGATLRTVEGNTAFGNGGSQDNGGAVAIRTRPVSLVHSIARPAY